MPLSAQGLAEAQGRVYQMFLDTVQTFVVIEQNVDAIFGTGAPSIRSAINEWLDDFMLNVAQSGERHPEALIFGASRASFQRAGFYGSQLDIKERQVTRVNAGLRQAIVSGPQRFWLRQFLKWVDVINNYLRSLLGATGAGEALMELKDCIRDELPED